MAGLGLGGVEARVAQAALVSGASVVTGFLAQMALEYFFRGNGAPIGTATSPVFEETTENRQVCELYRRMLREFGGDGTAAENILPEIDADERGRSPLNRASMITAVRANSGAKVYFRMNDLRDSHVSLKGDVRIVILRIQAKLKAYHASRPRRDGIVGDILYNAQSWIETAPITDHKLFILLIINHVLNTVGSYAQQMNPREAIVLIESLITFAQEAITARLDHGRESGRMNLYELLTSDTAGIAGDLEDLKYIFKAEIERRKFSIAIGSIEQEVFNLKSLLQIHILQWMQGDNVVLDRDAMKGLLSAAGARVPRYRNCEAIRRANVIEGTLDDIVLRFCNTRSSHSEDMYFILNLLFVPIELDPATYKRRDGTENSIGDRVRQALCTKLDLIHPDDHPERRMTAEEFQEYSINIISNIIHLIKPYRGLDVKQIATTLWDTIMMTHYFDNVHEIILDVSDLADLVGSLAPALLPITTKRVQHMVGIAARCAEEISESITAAKRSNRAYYDSRLEEMRYQLVEKPLIDSVRVRLVESRASLIIASSIKDLEARKEEIFRKVEQIGAKLGKINPEWQAMLARELSAVRNTLEQINTTTSADIGITGLETEAGLPASVSWRTSVAGGEHTQAIVEVGIVHTLSDVLEVVVKKAVADYIKEPRIFSEKIAADVMLDNPKDKSTGRFAPFFSLLVPHAKEEGYVYNFKPRSREELHRALGDTLYYCYVKAGRQKKALGFLCKAFTSMVEEGDKARMIAHFNNLKRRGRTYAEIKVIAVELLHLLENSHMFHEAMSAYNARLREVRAPTPPAASTAERVAVAEAGADPDPANAIGTGLGRTVAPDSERDMAGEEAPRSIEQRPSSTTPVRFLITPTDGERAAMRAGVASLSAIY